MKKIAIVCGNVSTYHVPIYRKIEKEKKLDLTVLYGSDEATRPYFNKELNHTLHYKNLLGGYKHIFLKNYFENDLRRGFFSRINFGIFKHLIFNKYDYVLIFGYDTATSWFAFLACILSRKKLLWRGEAIDFRKKKILYSLIKRIILKNYFRFFNTIFFSCEKNMNYLLKYTDISKLSFFPSAVDNKNIRDKIDSFKDKKKDILNQYNLNKNCFKIIFAGRFTKRKNVFDLLRIMNELKNDDIQLILVGNGPEFDNIKRYCKKNNLNVLLTGYLEHDELFKLLYVSNLFCICSYYDASPKIINEAMNFQLPIISRSTIGTAGDLVIHDKNGFIYNSIDELKDYVCKLYQDKNLRSKFSKESINILDTKFNVENIVKNLTKACK